MAPTARIRRGAVAVLTLAYVALAPASAPRAKEDDPFLRGVCFTSSTFQNQSEKELVRWVQESRINLVAVDFFLIGHSYGWTNLPKIARLVKRLKKEGVTVLADYRPSTSPPGVPSPGRQPDLCLSNADVRRNIIGWGLLLLDQVPGIDILTIYNPLPRFERNKECRECQKLGERALLELFFGEWSKALRRAHPKVRLGAVFVAGETFYGPVRDTLDVFCPFCSIIADRGRESAGPGVMKRVAADMRGLRKHGPVIPLVKLYWKEATKNTTEDILHAMTEAKEEGLDGFFLWYWSLLTGDLDRSTPFELPEYDLARIEARFRELAEPPGFGVVLREMRVRHAALARAVADAQIRYADAVLAGDDANVEAGEVVAAAQALRSALAEQKARVASLRVGKEHRRLRDEYRRLLDAALQDLGRFARLAARDADAAVRESPLYVAGSPRTQLALVRAQARLDAPPPAGRSPERDAYRASVDEATSARDAAARSVREALAAFRAGARGEDRARTAASALARTLRFGLRDVRTARDRVRALQPPEVCLEIHAAREDALRLETVASLLLVAALETEDEKRVLRWASTLQDALEFAEQIARIDDDTR